MEYSRWLLSLFFSLIIGFLGTDLFIRWMRSRRKDADPHKRLRFVQFIKKQDSEVIWGVPAWLTGTLERLFFTILIGADIQGAGVAMMTWLAVKMASNWHRITSTETDSRIYGFSALLGGMMSMLFALIGGLIYRYPCCWGFTGAILTMGTVTLILLVVVWRSKIRKKEFAIELRPFLNNLGLLFISIAALILILKILCH